VLTTTEIVQRQLIAMRSDKFEVGLYRPATDRNQKEAREMLLRTWDAETLLRSVSWLRFENKAGRNIYVRPAGEHQFSLVDDVSSANINRMEQTGFHPAAIVETSPGNFQAWMNHGQKLSKELGTAVARTLAQEFEGDTKAADWRHFGRLAGFTNQKEKHRQESGLFPYVQLIEATGQAYSKASQFIAAERERLEAHRKSRPKYNVAPKSEVLHRGPLKSIEAFRQDPSYGGDGTRSDLAYALYATSRGLSGSQIESALRSRDLSHKGTEQRQKAYVERTIRKALMLQSFAR